MNIYLIAAAGLTFILGFAHTLLGEKLILGPLLKKEQHKILGSEFIVRRTIRFAWHATTIVWWGISAIFLTFAGRPLLAQDLLILKIFSVTFFLSALLSLIAAHGKHFSWYVFLAISILSLLPTV